MATVKNDVMSNHKAMMAEERGNLYGLLGMIYSSELTPGVLKHIKQPVFLKTLSDLGVQLEGEFLDKPEDELIEDLAVEYARLFLGPGNHISPHESVHHERDDGAWGSLWGASTVEVKNFIETAGVEYGKDYKGLPDHISVEFEFMRKVISKEGEALAEGNSDGALYCRKIEQKFMEEHLIKWVPKFCDMVMDWTDNPFYRGMAALTKDFIDEEGEILK